MVDAQQKILTIIVPSYNMEQYLPKCLGSLIVAPELMERLEVLVVNDGSTDRTSEIAHEFAAKWPGTFKVIDKENGNYGSCINAALPIATGKYVKVLDADDWFETKAFVEYLQCLESITEVDLVITDYDTVNIDGVVTIPHRYEFDTEKPFPIEVFLKSKSYLPMHTFTYRTAILHEMGYRQLEGVSYTDTEWSTIPLLKVRIVRYFPKVVYKYLFGRDGQTMDPQRLFKSEWMRASVTLDILRQFLLYQNVTTDFVYTHFKRQILNGIVFVYKKAIVRKDALFDLTKFDADLKAISIEWYEKVGLDKYSRWIPYRYVYAWRNCSKMLPIMRCLCRVYSMLAMCRTRV